MYTLLLVSDEAAELLTLKYAVTTNFDDLFQIIEATDGNIAIDLCWKYQPELIIIDINISGKAGLDWIKAINSLNFTSILLITTIFSKASYIRRALNLGVTSYLLKPLNIQELTLAIQKCIRRSEEHLSQQRQISALICEIKTLQTCANKYLAQDILKGNAPSDVLTSAYGWPANGSLSVSVLC